MNDHSIIDFGKYKGRELIDVPDDWLLWFWRENLDQYVYGDKFTLPARTLRLMDYIKDSFNFNA